MLDTLPYLTKEEYQSFLIKLPGDKGFALRYPDKSIQERLAPNVTRLTKEALMDGEGTDIVCLGGGDAEREVLFFLSNDTGQSRETNLFVYDARISEPLEFLEYRTRLPDISMSYQTNVLLENFNCPQCHVDNTRLLSCFGVLDYLKPNDATRLLKKVRDSIRPDSFAIRLRVASAVNDPETNKNSRRELHEITQLLSDNYKLTSFGFKAFRKNSTFPIGWDKKECVRRNLSPDYPGTYFFPMKLVGFFSDDYDLAGVDAYRLGDSKYSDDILLFFKRKNYGDNTRIQ